MFKHAFHGGPAVEVFSTSGKNPLEKWKVQGNISKVFDSSIKGYIYVLDGQSKMQVPKDDKEILGLIQPFLVFQIFIPLGKNLHIEVGLTDSQKTKRRLIFHSGAKDIVSNPLHARIPINNFRRNSWVNLSLDIFAFAHNCFKGVNIRSIDLLVVTASCKIRKIFTMKNPLFDDQEPEDPELQGLINELMIEEQRDNLPFEHVPKNFQFPQGIPFYNQFIFPQRLKSSSFIARDENINQNNQQQSQQEQPSAVKKGADQKVQLAFGQRIPKGQQQQNVGQNKLIGKKFGNGGASDQKAKQQDMFEEQEDFYSPLSTDNQQQKQQQQQQQQEKNIKQRKDLLSAKYKNTNTKNQSNEKEDYDEWEGLHAENQSSGKKQSTSRGRKQQITKEELKESTHYLELQNDSDKEEESKQDEADFQDYNNQDDENDEIKYSWKPKQQQRKQQQQNYNNPWDVTGRKLQDKVISPTREQPKSNRNKNEDIKEQIKKQAQQILESMNKEDQSSHQFYSPIDQTPIRLDSEISDDVKIKEQYIKVNEMQSIIHGIEQKYTKRDEDSQSPEIERDRKKRFGFGVGKGNNGKVPLKQQSKQEKDKQEKMKKLSNYNGFNIDQWETDQQQQEIEFSIEEQFDINHDNLVQLKDKQPIEYQPKSASPFQKPPQQRKVSNDNQNAMYIEFELNNDDDQIDYDSRPTGGEDFIVDPSSPKIEDKVDQILDRLNGEVNTLDTNQLYHRLESSRKEERRPFSPPFKVQNELNREKGRNDNIMKVQKTQILRDSLDLGQNGQMENLDNIPPKATVENEDGEIIEVIYDPILKAFYEPRTNTYYELKQQ